MYSRNDSSYGGSGITNISDDRLSIKEVGKLKRWDKEKKERKNNILLKGMRREGDEKILRENMKDWVEKFIRDRLDVKIKIENC